jgi:hypothetical protein
MITKKYSVCRSTNLSGYSQIEARKGYFDDHEGSDVDIKKKFEIKKNGEFVIDLTISPMNQFYFVVSVFCLNTGYERR